MLLSHLGDFDCDSTANYALFSFLSLRAVSAHSQLVLVHSLWVSAHSQWSSQREKNFQPVQNCFQFAAQSAWSRTAVSVGSQCIRHQIDGDCAANPRRLQDDSDECTETALRIISLLLSSLPAFPWGLRGQLLKIKLPHLTVFHHQTSPKRIISRKRKWRGWLFCNKFYFAK